MKKVLFSLALAVCALTAGAASVTAPEAGKVYTIQNAKGGLYMTAEAGTLKLHALDATSAAQQFEFVPVEGAEGTWNIKMYNNQYVGTDGGWNVQYKTNPAEANAQYTIVVSAGNAEFVNLKCVGTEKNLGCDGTDDDAKVWTDKGDDESHRWNIAEAQKVAFTTPEAGQYYRLRHASGLYLTEKGAKGTLEEKIEDNTQVVEFVPVEGKEGVYNIRRMGSGLFYGSDKKWSLIPISRNHALAQFKIEASGDKVLLKNQGMNASKSCLGSDDTTAGSGVYTDKNGSDTEKHLWTIEPAEKYVKAPTIDGLESILVNGDFETEGFEQAQSEGGQMILSSLPGWGKISSDPWNGGPSINTTDEGNTLLIQGYQGNGWGNVGVSQEVTVVPGHSYVVALDYYHPTSDDCTWGYKVSEKRTVTMVNTTPDGQQVEVEGTKVVELAGFSTGAADTEWHRNFVGQAFTAESDLITIELYLNNKNTWWRDKKVEIDNVRLVDVTPFDYYADKTLPKGDPRANAYEGYKLVFAEEFSGDGALNHDIWNFEEGFKRNNEDQYYDGDANCYKQDGVLVIEGKYILDQKRRNPKYDIYNKTGWPSRIGRYLTWTSGSMQTKGSWDSGYTWHYGIYEVRAKVPQYVGSWPAIWSTGMQYEWPYGSEIDIMEYYGHAIHGNICVGNGNRYGARWLSATVGDAELGEGWGDEYHIWRMVWDYDHIELWCDDFLVNNINLDDTFNAVPTGDYDHGNGCNPCREVRQMLWLNLALGGDNGGSLANTPRPLYYLIDYARVYQKVGTDGKATYSVDEEISEPAFKYKDGETNPTSGVSTIEVSDNDSEVSAVYNLQGIRVANNLEQLRGNHGVFIVVRGDASEKVVL